ncbi:MAG: hypothetical protein ACQCN4_08990 [Candidatus Bathyarchaeia archaeon]
MLTKVRQECGEEINALALVNSQTRLTGWLSLAFRIYFLTRWMDIRKCDCIMPTTK